jgi:hypothetical protein
MAAAGHSTDMHFYSSINYAIYADDINLLGGNPNTIQKTSKLY